MKKFRYIFLLALPLLLTNCDTNDDGFYNSVFADLPNLVSIEAHATTYTIGEKLRIIADFSRLQDEDGQLLDIYTTTGGAPEFTFSYVVEKQINTDTWEAVTVLDSQLDVIEGAAQNGSYVYGHCIYDGTSESYQYNVGFPLQAVGNYRLSFGYNSSSTNSVELRSESAPGKLVLNINSTITNVNGSGYYNFTVN